MCDLIEQIENSKPNILTSLKRSLAITIEKKASKSKKKGKCITNTMLYQHAKQIMKRTRAWFIT